MLALFYVLAMSVFITENNYNFEMNCKIFIRFQRFDYHRLVRQTPATRLKPLKFDLTGNNCDFYVTFEIWRTTRTLKLRKNERNIENSNKSYKIDLQSVIMLSKK